MTPEQTRLFIDLMSGAMIVAIVAIAFILGMGIIDDPCNDKVEFGQDKWAGMCRQACYDMGADIYHANSCYCCGGPYCLCSKEDEYSNKPVPNLAWDINEGYSW